ncbi:hypothetical protein PCASD_23589 [Puccinia coronata f. sp. avenae]|uniref:Uncharacterized protein n=1 Tax=Puccinia coronata f. sp. avenae TaxID=200324 RepID=A0A2N5TV07_9BASI|nr:hypothetical protein PCASD_23589 [Puccinia coronata f. sp. avenae]
MFSNSFLYNAQPLLGAGGLYLPTRLVSYLFKTVTIDQGYSGTVPTIGLGSIDKSKDTSPMVIST